MEELLHAERQFAEEAGLAMIRAALSHHGAQPLNLVSLLCNNVPWRSSFSRPSFGPYRDPGFSLPLFGTFPFHKAFYDILIPKTKILRYFSLRFSQSKHSFDFRQQFLYMRVIPFSHSNTP